MIGECVYGAVKLSITWSEHSVRPLLSQDGTTLEVQEVSHRVLCVYNPAATCYSAPGVDRVPVQSNKAFAGETHVSLREYLATPRRLLLIKYGDDTGQFRTFVESPPLRANKRSVSDARNGPVCEVQSITQHFGTRTFEVMLNFKTWIACQDSRTPLLSLRFRKSCQIDQDFFPIIVTQGEATFDVGRLWSANPPLSPDYWRSTFFAPPPPSFAREQIHVEVSEDNSTARFTTIDRYRVFGLGLTSAACRIEGFLTTDYQQGSLAMAQAQIAESGLGLVAGMAQQATLWDPVRDAGILLGGAAQMAGIFYRAIRAQMPRYYIAIKLRAWGAPESKRLDLFELLMGIAIAKLGPTPDFLTAANSTQVTITQEITGKYVELDMINRYSDDILTRLAVLNNVVVAGTLTPAELTTSIPQALAGLQGIVNNLGSNGRAFYMPYIRATEDVTGLMSQGITTNRAPMGPANTGNPDQYARSGVYLQKLIVNGLSGQCETPPVPGREPTDSALQSV